MWQAATILDCTIPEFYSPLSHYPLLSTQKQLKWPPFCKPTLSLPVTEFQGANGNILAAHSAVKRKKEFCFWADI